MRRRADRVAAGRFLAEGPRVAGEALDAHRRGEALVLELFLTPDAADHHVDLVTTATRLDVRVHLVTENVCAAIAETRTPQGVVAVCRMPSYGVSDIRPHPQLVVVLTDVSDPGNAGTVIRTADGAGADAVIFCGQAVDPYNGKCVRASAGSVFHLPVLALPDAASALDTARALGLAVFVADGRAELDLDAATRTGILDRPVCWIFGSEAHGVTAGVLASADATIRVPIYGRAESLNLATAAAICLYTSARSRHSTG